MKNLINFFAATILLLTLAIPNAFAQTSTWDGTTASWTHGTGTEADPYLIESAQNLAYLAEMVNGGVSQYSGKWFKLTININLNNMEWTPIGDNNTTSARFAGNFDGDNHTISGLNINSSSLQYCGLFGYVYNNRIFKNIKVSEGTLRTTASSSYCGGIVGYAYGSITFDNCSNSASVSVGGVEASGGLIGYGNNTITMTDCHNSSSVSASCTISSPATAYIYSGGLIGYGNSTITINNCTNSGNVTATLYQTSTGTNSNTSCICRSCSGGIVGYIAKGTITCVNTGNVSSISNTKGRGNYVKNYYLYTYSYSGGIAGYSDASSSSSQISITLCYNTGIISASATNQYSTADSHQNYTPVYSYSGGILGSARETSYSIINNSYNRGDVAANSRKSTLSHLETYEYASGIGYNSRNTNCYNTGTLTAHTSCSSIYKYGIGNGTTTNCYYLGTCGSTGGNGTTKTESAMKSESFPVILNSEVFMMDFIQHNVNDGYPIFGTNLYVITESVTDMNFTTATLNGWYYLGTSYPNPPDMQGFEWKAASASEWDTEYTNVGTTASYNLTGLTNGTTYQYRMFVKFGDVTIYGNTVEFTTRACNVAVSVAAEDTTICSNASTLLTARATPSFNITSYSWSTGADSTDIAVNAAGTYTVTVTNSYNCTAVGSITIATIAAPTAAISGNAYICTGNSTTLTASGGVGYVWSTGATTPSINVSEPNEYYVVARASNGCTDTAYVTVANFNEVVISGNTSICAGESTTLSVSEANSYLWSTGATTQSIQVTEEGLYSVTATNSTCEAHTSVYVAINALPTATISGTTAICGGTSTTLTANGGTGYVWSNGATTASTEVSTSGNYSVTVTNSNGCAATASTSVVSAPNPSVQITGNPTACEGTQITLVASGGTSYSWSNAANTATINPTQSGTYTVTAYNDLGCFATASANVTINPNPQLNITAPHTICNNSSTTLEVSDNLGSTITSCVWSNGGSGSSIMVSPTSTTNYTVTVTNNNGCVAHASTSVVVAEQLSFAISGNTSICGNESAELTVSGIAPANVSTYAWSNGANTASVSVSASGTYSVIVTDVNGCTGYATTTVSAAENPVASISGQQSVCSGSSATLLANGGTSYQWSNGSTEASISVTAGGTYSVVVANGAGCTATASAAVTVNESPNPEISGNLSICEGESTTLTVNGGDSFVWSNGSSNSSINVTNSGTYTVIASNANGCTASASATVNVSENPIVTISGNPAICDGGVTTLTAEGGNSYLWSTGFPGASINVNAAGTYSVIATGANGCTSSAELTVAQYSAPEVSITGNTTVCEGSSTTITANGGVSYQWSTGETGASISVNAFGVYSVTATGNGGCSATANATVFVASAPTPSISGNLHICDNETTTLTANGGDSYMWSNGSIGNSIEVSNGGTYSVIASNANGCTAMVSANVEAGHSVANSISETAATEFTWNGHTYSESGDYQQSFIAANGCDSIVTLHLTITGSTEPQQYNIFVMSNNNAYGTTTGTGVYEENEVVTISASAYSGYEFVSWSDGNTGNPRQITVTGNATYVANFAETGSVPQATYTITVVSSDASAGVVSGSGTYLVNTQVVILAEANAGYMFVSWSDGVGDNPRIITVTEDATYTAMFMQSGSIETYTINALSGNPNYGTVYGGGTYAANTFVNLYAIAYEGYEFVSWSDGNTDNPRRIAVTGNAMYIATFVPSTGIEENVALEINVFPNPATDILNITSSETISEIEIVNVIGQVVKRLEVNSDNAVCDVEELTAGVYVVRIRTASATLSQRKFVKE